MRLSPLHRAHMEYGTFTTLHLLFAAFSVVLQYLGIGSAAAGFFCAVSSFAALLLQFALSIWGSTEDITLPAYFIAQFIPSTFGCEIASTFVDIFVPLVRRRTHHRNDVSSLIPLNDLPSNFTHRPDGWGK